MPDQITYDEKAHLVRVRVCGTTTIEEMTSSMNEVLDLHRAHGVTRLFIDLRDMLRAANTADLFEFGREWPQSLRAAILVGENAAEDIRFLETVAVNRGRDMQVFVNEAAAMDWLEE